MPASSVTASLPRPLIPDDAYAVATAEAVPVSVVTEPALIVPLVSPSSPFRSDAATVVSSSVTASLPRPLIPGDPYAIPTSDSEPVTVPVWIGIRAPPRARATVRSSVKTATGAGETTQFGDGLNANRRVVINVQP